MSKAVALFLLVALLANAEPLFNGKDLSGWKNAIPGGGKVEVLKDGSLSCQAGDPMSGIVYTNRPPRMNYELTLEAMRVSGDDFFIGLTIPVETNCCTVIIGGWGGSLCGVSSVDYMDASENPYTESRELKSNQWYRLKIRVTPGLLDVSLDGDFYTAKIPFDKPDRFSLRPGSDIDRTAPLGICTYRTGARWRNMELKTIAGKRDAKEKD